MNGGSTRAKKGQEFGDDNLRKASRAQPACWIFFVDNANADVFLFAHGAAVVAGVQRSVVVDWISQMDREHRDNKTNNQNHQQKTKQQTNKNCTTPNRWDNNKACPRPLF